MDRHALGAVALSVLLGCGGAQTPAPSSAASPPAGGASGEAAPVVDPALPLADATWPASPAHLFEPLPWSLGISVTPCEVRYLDARGRLTSSTRYRYDAAGRLVAVDHAEVPDEDGEADPAPPAEEDAEPEESPYARDSYHDDEESEYEWAEPPLYCGSLSQSFAPFTELEWSDDGRLRCARNETEYDEPTERCFEYDDEGRLISWAATDGSEHGTVRWDEAGHPAAIDGSFWSGEATDTLSLEYEGDRLARIRRAVEGGDSGSRSTWTYRYDAAGRVSSLDVHEEVSWEGPGTASRDRRYVLRYDDDGLVERCEHDGVTVRYTRTRGRLSELSAERDGEPLDRIELSYDCD